MPLKHKIGIFFVCLALLLPVLPAMADEKSELQRQLDEIEAQIANYRAELKTVTGEKNTLQNKIKRLQNQQASINLQIKATNLQIKDLDGRILETKAAIENNTAKIADVREELASGMRLIKKYDDFPLFFVLITQKNWSDALDELQRYLEIAARLGSLFDEAKQLQTQLDWRASALSDEQDEARELLSIKTLQQQQLAGSVKEQNSLLAETKGKESEYQAIIKDSQKKANEIKNRLYGLLETSKQITFGEAVEIAQWASDQTGVRAAFLLAILTQESNLGQNVGTCNRAGDPPSKSWRVVMKPTRDWDPFKQITAELGRDIDITPVSCPMHDSRGNQIGWGGAMGPAQFIPSTWMGYKAKVEAITGKTADPWDIRDAFLASAIKLKAGGAGKVAGEWAAAMRYFAGTVNVKYRFYGDNVVRMAANYQDDINAMK